MPMYLTKTGLTDQEKYRTFCTLAATDSNVFNTFRNHSVCRWAYEHVDHSLALSYLSLILETGITTETLHSIASNDLVGAPSIIEVKDGIKISATTLRHAKVACDFQKYFGSLKGAKICEIGVGYGGLCRIVDSLYNIQSYALIDTQYSLGLAKRYLSCFSLRSQLNFLTMNEAGNEDYDLVISNYAFSELTRDIQKVYLQKIVKRSRCGYMIYNNICPPEYKSMLSEEMATFVNGTILPETPCTNSDNRLIIWSNN